MISAWFRIFIITVALATANASYASEPPWHPYMTTEGIVFPSLILATRNMDLKQFHKTSPSPDYLGDATGLYGIKINNPAPNTKIRVTITIDGLSETSTYEGILADAGREYTVMPYIRYKADALWRVKQPYPTTAIFSVSLGGAPAEETTEKMSVRTVNDVPLAIVKDGKDYDTSFLFGAFVNENAPIIDDILQDALEHNAVSKFDGYNGNKQDFARQLFAVWNALQRKGVKYSNVTTPSGLTENIYSQHVRLPDESYGNSQANCVDGTVLLASIFYKIGMCPILVSKPGHMFLGVYNDAASCERKDHKNITYLETTAVGAVHLNPVQKAWKFKTNDGYLVSTSYASLTDASNAGRKQYNEMVPALNLKQQGYRVLDIQQLRSLGITPISSIKE